MRRSIIGTLPARLLGLLIRGYQLLVSPFLPPSCRFVPTCSEYAREALARHGVLRGGGMALRRLSRCHPWGGAGIDPVPRSRRTSGPPIGRSWDHG